MVRRVNPFPDVSGFLTIYAGETGGLTVTFDDGYTGSRSGSWSVDDNTVASIDQNGVVTGKKAGTAIVAYVVDATPAASVVRNRPVSPSSAIPLSPGRVPLL